ncbi:MAG: J domain-containing protein [Lagierella massiliensis]|nr:J domain-containing protein [Lagierella massiliensis]
MKKLWGKFILGLADVLDFLIGGLIKLVGSVVDVITSLGKSLLMLLGVLACSGIIFLLPLVIIYLPVLIFLFFFFIIIPLLGRKFISYLEFLHYSAVEYLRNYGDYLINNKENYKSYEEFKSAYRNKKAEEERRERERQRAQNQFWEEIFRNVNSSTYNKNWSSTQGNYSSYYGRGATYSNPYDDFKRKYEESCKILEVPLNTNVYEVKTAYRKMAKKYHPDLNNSPKASEMFQKVNTAYEFLTEENIQRYKSYVN